MEQGLNTQPISFINTELPDLIELRNIRQTYDGGKSFIIDGFNLLIEDKPDQGQFVVILGKSGCGKSTVLRYLSGLQNPSSGEVLIEGKDKKDDYTISMVFQQYSSLPWMSVLDNVMLPLRMKGVDKKESKERAKQMLQKVGLEGHEKKYAQYPILSGGQLQRVAIARSLISNPRVILMDEPFGALDTKTRTAMQHMLQDIWLELKSTIIFVTHDIPEAVFLGDDVYIMSANPGMIVKYIHIDLPLVRTREIKKTTEFINYVSDIEAQLMEY